MTLGLTRTSTFLLVISISGCGARSDLSPLSRADGSMVVVGRDSGPPIPFDAGPPPPPPPPPPPACTILPSEPFEVFRNDCGVFDRPRISLLPFSGIDVLVFSASFQAHCDDRRSGVFVRGGQASRDGDLRFVTEPEMMPDSLAGLVTACSSDRLVLADVRGSVMFFHAPALVPLSTQAADSPIDFEGNDSGVFLIGQNSFNTTNHWIGCDGSSITMPFSTFPVDTAADAAVTRFRDGFAWAGYSTGGGGRLFDTSGEIPLGIDFDIGARARHVAITTRRMESGFAVAAYHPDGALKVSLIDWPAGQTALSLPIGLAVTDPQRPAIAEAEGRLFVAAVEYGDGIPSDGFLRVSVLDELARSITDFSMPTRRDGGLTTGGVDIVGRGRVAVVHWAEQDPDSSDMRTMAMTLQCR
jgi:hypothetical protein